jgi:ribosome-binding factor A
MPSRRAQKVAEAIREVVSMAILAEMKDPRVQNVTVTYVEVAGDLRSAKIHVSVMGDENKQRLAVHGLNSAAGFLQARCAARIDMRYTPRLQFLLDQGVKKSIAIAKILSEVLPKPAEPLPDSPAAEEPLPEESPVPVPVVETSHPPPAPDASGDPSSPSGSGPG